MNLRTLLTPIVATIMAMTSCLSSANTGTAPASTADVAWPIITRKGDALYEGATPFRFFGIAAPNLHQNENQLLPDYSNRWPSEYEIRDTLEAMRYLGARATRTFSLSVYSPDDDPKLPVYITGRRQYNEEALRTLDLVLALAHEYDIRLIIPLIASQHFGGWHGVDEFAALAGKPPLQGVFWTDEEVKADYKHLFATLANRKNTVTGILYKDDPAILAWQFGNEFDVYAYDNHFDVDTLKKLLEPWCSEMAAYMKSVDPKHLVMSAGFHLPVYIEDPNIDVVSIHLYEHWNHLSGNFTPLADIAEQEWQLCKGKKPLIVDEFGMGKPDNMQSLMAEIRQNGITGGLIWGIRSHRRDGGWYYHNEGGSVHNSYHIPGFDTGRDYFERQLLDMLRLNAHAIRGMEVPAIREPVQAPEMLALGEGLTWRGSTLAQYYVLQRAASPDGPWTTIATGIQDSQVPNALALENSNAHNPGPLYLDQTGVDMPVKFYRVKGVNTSGESPWSPVFAAPDNKPVRE
jgi:hypothetical protein